MGILHWIGPKTTSLKYYHHENVNVDIHDWRLLWQGRIYLKRYGRDEHGTFISAKDQIRFVPHLKISDIMEINFKGRDYKQTAFHASLYGCSHAITYCNECRGAGKFDWITQTARERRLQYLPAQQSFERDESTYYVYPGCNTMLLAHAKLYPGDIHCTSCKGIGLEVDGRHTIYRGMKGIKQKLYPIEAEDYNDKLKLKGLLK